MAKNLMAVERGQGWVHINLPGRAKKGADMYFQLYPSVGQWRWRLKAANHKIIADSGESYWNKADALHAIKLVKGSAVAPIYE